MPARLCPNPSCRKESGPTDDFCRYCGTRIRNVQPDTRNNQGNAANETDFTDVVNGSATPARPRDETIAKDELWSWLKRDERRQLFFTSETNNTTEEEYVHLVSEKLRENDVPAVIERRQIRWDTSEFAEQMWFVKLNANVVDPLACFLEFTHVGKYSFAEQKTFLAPPKLPELPGKERDIPEDGGQFLLPAFLLIGFGLWFVSQGGTTGSTIGMLIVAAGIGLLIFDRTKHSEYRSAIEHNESVKRKLKKWLEAWNDWQDTFFVYSFQEGTHGQASRIYEAVFDCIKQVNDELFKGVDREETRDDQSINELEELIARRKEAYR